MMLLHSFLHLLLVVLPVFAQDKPVFTTSNLPKTWEKDQVGTNQCQKWAPSSQHSKCQNIFISSASDFCLFGPFKKGGGTVGDLEKRMVSYCTRSGFGTRLIPKGTLTGAHFLKTPDFLQVTGYGDFTKIDIQAHDDGGELDGRGFDGQGNPAGAIIFVHVNGQFQQAKEWSNFMSATEFSIRACFTDRAQDLCPHIYDEMGSQWNHPGDYSKGFSYCESDSGPRPGWFHGKQWFQHQKPEPKGHKAPKTRNCHKVKESAMSGHRSKYALFKGKGSKRDEPPLAKSPDFENFDFEDFLDIPEVLRRDGADIVPGLGSIQEVLEDVEELKPLGRILDHLPLRRDDIISAVEGIVPGVSGIKAVSDIVDEALSTVEAILPIARDEPIVPATARGVVPAIPDSVDLTGVLSDLSQEPGIVGDAIRLVEGVVPVRRTASEETLSSAEDVLPAARDASATEVADGLLPDLSGTSAVTEVVDEVLDLVSGVLPVRRLVSGASNLLEGGASGSSLVGGILNEAEHLTPISILSKRTASQGAGKSDESGSTIVKAAEAAVEAAAAKVDVPVHAELASKPFKFNKLEFGATNFHQARGRTLNKKLNRMHV